jgi:hypothetical protein
MGLGGGWLCGRERGPEFYPQHCHLPSDFSACMSSSPCPQSSVGKLVHPEQDNFVSQGPREGKKPSPPEVNIRGKGEGQEVGRWHLGPKSMHEQLRASDLHTLGPGTVLLS